MTVPVTVGVAVDVASVPVGVGQPSLKVTGLTVGGTSL